MPRVSYVYIYAVHNLSKHSLSNPAAGAILLPVGVATRDHVDRLT